MTEPFYDDTLKLSIDSMHSNARAALFGRFAALTMKPITWSVILDNISSSVKLSPKSFPSLYTPWRMSLWRQPWLHAPAWQRIVIPRTAAGHPIICKVQLLQVSLVCLLKYSMPVKIGYACRQLLTFVHHQYNTRTTECSICSIGYY